MKPRTDLCDTCHKFKTEIHSCKDEKERQSQKKFDQHKQKTEKQRKCYNKIIKLVKRQRKIVDKNYQ